MFGVGWIGQQQETRHSRFEDESGAPIGTKHRPLPHALDRLDASASEFFFESADLRADLNRFQVAARAIQCRDYRPTTGSDASTHRFDFREFGHGPLQNKKCCNLHIQAATDFDDSPAGRWSDSSR